MTITAAATPHRDRKYGGGASSGLTISSGSFSHDEANPRFQKSAVGFAQSPLRPMTFPNLMPGLPNG
jgi:hypothetical protein